MATNIPDSSDSAEGTVFDEHTLCSACGFSAAKQNACDYKSSVKLVEGAGDRGQWSIGSRFVLKERSKRVANTEPANLRFVQRHTAIPVMRVVAEWTEPADGAHLTLAERVPGEPLDRAWPRMSAAGRRRAAEQTGALLQQQLRPMQAPRMQSADGGPLCRCLLFTFDQDAPHGPYAADAELWAALEALLGSAPSAERQRLRDSMPPCGPYTFSHGDLNITNIMVDGAAGNVTAILDWESASYYPVWWEYASATTWAISVEDAEWRRLLADFLELFPEASKWFLEYRKVASKYRVIDRKRYPL